MPTIAANTVDDTADDQAVIRSRVSRAMNDAGMTATELARRAGVASSTITRFLNNKDYRFIPNVRTLTKLASVMGVAVSDLIPEKSGDINADVAGRA